VLGEKAGRLDQEPGPGLASLIVQDLADGDPGAVIDGRVHGVMADAWTSRGGGAAVGAVAAPIGDPAQLLDIQVDQLAWPLALVAPDDAAGPVGAGKPVPAVAAQHP
jgi:hypothetical protein